MPITEVKKSGVYELLKRLMDIVCAAILIVLFSPVILIVSIAIKLDSEGPIFADVPESESVKTVNCLKCINLEA